MVYYKHSLAYLSTLIIKFVKISAYEWIDREMNTPISESRFSVRKPVSSLGIRFQAFGDVGMASPLRLHPEVSEHVRRGLDR